MSAPQDSRRGERPRRSRPRWRALPIARAVLLAAGSFASAARAAPLTLADALRRAEEVSEEVRIARSRAAAAATERRVARSFRLPLVSGVIHYERSFRTPFTLDGLPPDVRLPFGHPNTWWGGFGLSQLVFDAGAASAQVRIAEETSSVAGLLVLETVADVRLAVVEAYLAASLAERELAVLAASGASVASQRELLAARSGPAAALDAERAALEEAALEPERVAARTRLDLALGRLATLLNLPLRQALSLADDPLARAPVLPSDAALERLLKAADRRPALEAGTRSVTASEHEARGAHAALFPTVTLLARFGGWAAPDEIIPQRVDFASDWAVSLVTSVAVFDWGRGRAREAAAREGASQSRLELSRLQQQLGLDVHLRRLELERTVALSAAAGPRADRAARLHDAVAAAYREGQASHLDLADARATLRKARTEEASARHDAHRALARLQRAAGVPPSLDPLTPSAAPADGEVLP